MINSLGKRVDKKIEEEKEKKRLLEKARRQKKIADAIHRDDMVDFCGKCNCKLWGITLEIFMKYNEISKEKARKQYLKINDNVPKDAIIYQECPQCKIERDREIKRKIEKEKREDFGIFSKSSINNPRDNNQIKLFEKFKENTISSFYISGDVKTGKSWGMYAIANQLIKEDLVFQYHDFKGTKLTNEIYQYQKTGKSKFNTTFLSNLNPYREGENIYLLIWDGLDKIKFSEYIIKELVTIFDLFCSKGNRFQFMITSNKSFYDITQEISEKDNGRYSHEAYIIGRKISEKCNNGNNIIEFN